MKLCKFIDKDMAVKIIDAYRTNRRGKKKDELPADHYLTTKSNGCILAFPIILQSRQWEEMLPLAESIVFWHYNYEPTCHQSIEMKFGDARYSITFSKMVKPDEVDGLSTEVVE
jgi:hypothetical protein